MKKLLSLVAISVLFLSINVNQAMAGTIFDVFFDVEVVDAVGNAVEGAECKISDPGFGIVKSGIITDNTGSSTGSFMADLSPGDDVIVECEKDSASNSQTVTVDSSRTISATIVFDIIVGGENLPIETTALLLAATQSPSAWLSAFTIAALGIGVFVFTRNPSNMRNIKVILQDYLDRF